MATYTGVFNAPNLVNDDSFINPIQIPSDFLGFHNNSFGTLANSQVTQTAQAYVTLDSAKNPIVHMISGGGNYYNAALAWSNTVTVGVVFTGGDPLTHQAIGFANVSTNGSIIGVNIVDPGDYQSIPPNINFVITGGPSLPPTPSTLKLVRVHDYMGSRNSPHASAQGYPGNEHWYDVDPGWSGVGTFPGYDWSILDEIILYNKAIGNTVLYDIYGTPRNYAVYPTLINQPYDNYAGGSSPLNALGLHSGLANVGLEGFIKALVTRYNVNAHLLVNPLTGNYFPQGTRLIDIIEVLNEPQFGTNGSALSPSNGAYWLGSSAQAVDFIKIVSYNAKQLDPGIKIAGCGFIGGNCIRGRSFNDMLNVMTSTDTGSYLPSINPGYTGYQWVDYVSIHYYDFTSNGDCNDLAFTGASPTYGNKLYNSVIPIFKQNMLTYLGSIKPIIMSEIGFYNNSGPFRTNPDYNYRAIKLARILANYFPFAGDIRAIVGYSLNSFNSCLNPGSIYNWNVLTKLGTCCGKTLVGLSRGNSGQMLMKFSDGSQFYTG